MSKYKIGVLGLRMGHAWAKAAHSLPDTGLSIVYDKYFNENELINHDFYLNNGYVGAGPGKVTLYKGKDVAHKNIPEIEAIPMLISLIKKSGDWKERAGNDL